MLLSYSIVSSLILLFGCLAWRVTLGGERDHRLNRVVILSIYATSLLLPLVVLPILMRHPVVSATEIEIGALTAVAAGDGPEETSGGLYWLGSIDCIRVIYSLYMAGVVVMICQSLFGLFILTRMVRRGERIDEYGYRLIIIDDTRVAPFIWGRKIVMSRADYGSGCGMILSHECAHLDSGHRFDLFLAQVTVILQWYNPAAWKLRHYLRDIHEYQADEIVLSSGVDTKAYQMMLMTRALGSRNHSMASSLTQSKLKKRIIMMYKEKTSMRRRLAAILILPALAAGCCVAAVPVVAGAIESFASVKAPGAQTGDENKTENKTKKRSEVYLAVEQDAEAPGGMSGLMKYLAMNIRYPEEAAKNDIQGRVIVKFVVEADGSIADPTVINSVSPELDAEAIRVMKGMPKWTPGKVNGKPVASWYHLPISFKLSHIDSDDDGGQGEDDKTVNVIAHGKK